LVLNDDAVGRGSFNASTPLTTPSFHLVILENAKKYFRNRLPKIATFTGVAGCLIAIKPAHFFPWVSRKCVQNWEYSNKFSERSLMATENKKFGTVLIDFPWDLQQKGKLGSKGRGAGCKYPLMTLDEIQAMPIADLLEDDAHVWCWVTQAALEPGFKILREYGLIPKSVFTWVKPRMGLGNFLRSATEFIILATKGNCPIQFKGQINWGIFPVQGHSHKPEEVHKIIERCSPGPYLELFARRKFPGWSVWGNEVESDISIPGYPVPNSPSTRTKKSN